MASERKKIIIQTLTPVHIGSGEVLRKNFDYVEGKIDGYSYLSIIDQKKIIQLLTVMGVSIDMWVACLQKGNQVNEFINKFLPNITIEDYAQRLVYFNDNQEHIATELRENIHDGFGNPYIPGSSIKGAIRTVILSSLLQQENGFCSRPDMLFNKKKRMDNGTEVEYNLMHLLEVSDAYFEQEGMDALNMINLNIRENNSFYDDKAKQLVEVITAGETSSLVMKISDMKGFAYPIKNINELFFLINNHTLRIVQDEIEFWNDYTNNDNTDTVENYIKACRDIRKQINSLNENSCILRVGHANGWKFMTGDWARDKTNHQEWNDVVNKSRPRNKEKYLNYPFPKSRRINVLLDDNGYIDKVQLLGFVKLTIEE